MGGIRVLRLFGIDVYLHQSLLLIFAIVLASLALGAFPSWHPGWSAATAWGTAIAATVAFFVSILLHELSHALVAKARGLPVSRITLFLFGGVASIEREPPSAGTELVMAGVGPLTSLAIGLGCSIAGIALIDGGDPVDALKNAGPFATVLLWLGQVNLVLGVFNLVPGFPLDGGRVLRAILWAATGNLRSATRAATVGGRLVASLLMAAGLAMALGMRVPFFGTGAVPGLWLLLIGWFLHGAAIGAWRELLVHESLRDVPVTRVMRTHVRGVPPELPVSRLVDEWLLRSELAAVPVMDGEQLLGQVSVEDVRRIPRDAWASTPVRSIMTRVEDLPSLGQDDDADDALRAIGRGSLDQIPVVKDGRLEGVVRRDDLVNWLTLHEHDGPRP